MLTTNNSDYDKKLRLLRHHGMSLSDVARHQAKKIIREEYLTTGYNYRMTDIQAAVGIEQCKKLPGILEERIKLNRLYKDYLGTVEWIQLPDESEYAKSNWQSYPVKILQNTPLPRNDLMQLLLDHKIASKPGISNTHLEKPYIRSGYSLKNSENANEQVLLLPFYNGLKKQEIEDSKKAMKT